MSEVQETSNATPQPSAPVRMAANIISAIFHPVFMPLVMTLVVYKLAPAGFAGLATKQRMLLFISIGVSTLFFPLFSIALMKPLGFIASFKMPTTKDRIIPLMAIMIFYFWISHVLNNMAEAVPLSLKVLMLGNFWGIILVFLVNIFTKISMHTSAAGGMIGILSVLLILSPANIIVPFFVALVLAGIIGSARLALGAHQKGDVWLGYIIGVAVQLGAYVYMK